MVSILGSKVGPSHITNPIKENLLMKTNEKSDVLVVDAQPVETLEAPNKTADWLALIGAGFGLAAAIVTVAS
jgi:hypothetical protein